MRNTLKYILLTSLLLGGLSACNSKADTIISNQTQVLKQDPNNVSALIERGNAFRDKNDYPNALADHNKAIELSNTSARAYLSRGLDYMALNQFENAVDDLTKSLSLNPDQGEAYARRGEARVQLKSAYQQALNDFDKAQSMGFNDVRMQRFRGQAYFRLNQKDLALAAYLKSAEANDPPQRDAQILSLNEALDLGLTDYQLYLRRGVLLRMSDKLDLAVDDFTEVIRQNGQNANAFEERADAYYRLGSCSKAEQDLRAACHLQNRSLCDAITIGCSSPSASPKVVKN